MFVILLIVLVDSIEIHRSFILYGPQCEKNCLWGFANNKGADQPAETGLSLALSETPKTGFVVSRPIYM